MIIGFTGTQNGMTPEQIGTVNYLLGKHKPEEVHHGDCKGADADFHNISRTHKIDVVLHPPIKDVKRAFCSDYFEAAPKKDYLDRNRDIVDACELLIATPKEKEMQQRSGTWYTIRYALRMHRRVIIVFPDGTEKVY